MDRQAGKQGNEQMGLITYPLPFGGEQKREVKTKKVTWEATVPLKNKFSQNSVQSYKDFL